MRIITGSARGIQLKTPPGDDTRPTTDRVKESIFNIIQFDIEGRDALDLFAGSGQLGLEAVSRGAASATFVDNNTAAVKIIRENVEKCRFGDSCAVINGDYKAFCQAAAARGQRFHLIFLDPPYSAGYLAKLLAVINKFDILHNNGIIVCEGPNPDALPEISGSLVRGRQYIYGQTMISLFIKEVTV